MAGGPQPYEGGFGMNPINPVRINEGPPQGPPVSPPQSLEDFARMRLQQWMANNNIWSGNVGAFRRAFTGPNGGVQAALHFLQNHPGFVNNHQAFMDALNSRYGIDPNRRTNFGGHPPIQGRGATFGGNPPQGGQTDPMKMRHQTATPTAPMHPAADSLKQLGGTVNRLIKAHAGTFGYGGM